MKTLKLSIEDFTKEAMSENEMNFLKGGGDPHDLLIPPTTNYDTKEN